MASSQDLECVSANDQGPAICCTPQTYEDSNIDFLDVGSVTALPPDDSDDGEGEDTNDEDFEPKRARVDPDQLFAVRRRLFYDDSDRPTQDVFYMEGERIDFNDPESCAVHRALFARIFNSVLAFSKCRITEKDTVHRNLAWAMKLTQNRVAKLVQRGYKEYHLCVPSIVSYILRAVEDINYIRCDELLFQLVPITCVVDKGLKERLDVNSLEVRKVNGSRSLSVNLNTDVKFLYAGQFRVKTILDQGEKYYVAPSPFMGSYLNEAVSELYNLIYDRTKQYVKRFFDRYPKDPDPAQSNDAFGDHQIHHREANDLAGKRERDNAETLSYLLSAVGRGTDLKRMDIEKNNVFTLTSTIKTKPKYLSVKGDGTFTVESHPRLDAEAVFLSSYTRARIMEDGSLNFQIYSRACMYMSDDEVFPEMTPEDLAAAEIGETAGSDSLTCL